jgi:hypothetical protein
MFSALGDTAIGQDTLSRPRLRRIATRRTTWSKAAPRTPLHGNVHVYQEVTTCDAVFVFASTLVHPAVRALGTDNSQCLTLGRNQYTFVTLCQSTTVLAPMYGRFGNAANVAQHVQSVIQLHRLKGRVFGLDEVRHLFHVDLEELFGDTDRVVHVARVGR